MFFLYSLLYGVAAVILLPFEYARRPAPVRKRWLKEKFGCVDLPTGTEDSPLLWIHAVSVGETLSAVPFIKEIKGRYPSIRVVLSTITDTGQAVARERLAGVADAVYLPFDLSFCIKPLFRKIRPSAFIVIETELWPNIFRVSKKMGIPLLVMNGRLSEKSFRGYMRIRFFMKAVLECVDLFCMQEKAYAERITALGADEGKVIVTGSFKFDTGPPGKLPEWAWVLKGPVILAGSTHPGEEELILGVYEDLRQDFPGLNLIIAPRRPDRFQEVYALMKARGFSCKKRSEISGVSPAESGLSPGTIVLLDTVGELAAAYGICDIAIIGGSFIRHGGQNPLEPAFWQKPIICGPHMENFSFIEEFYRKGAAEKTEREGLRDLLKELLGNGEKRKTMGEAAKALYREKAGAVNRAIDALGKIVLSP
ncbi:MAG TPA: 3-deoxy-D-manno-octulosonic acid transferase [Thermodesulfovibrionales bacterium]|nr:3-deoxy-D-manno-octulosonic acid transferase [Thermodesulfovibrionales bacterium]